MPPPKVLLLLLLLLSRHTGGHGENWGARDWGGREESWALLNIGRDERKGGEG